MVNRTENYSFSISNLTIYNYATGKPYVSRQFAPDGSATLNSTINVAIQEGGDVYGTKMVEPWGGAHSLDATIVEFPIELMNICNQGSLTTVTTCASAVAGTITNKSGDSISAYMITAQISAGTHGNVVNDVYYIEALSSSTYKITSYITGKSSGTLSLVSGTSVQIASAFAPGLQIIALSAGSIALSTGDTATVTTTPIHFGTKTSQFGHEKVCSTTVYVGCRGTAVNCSDQNEVTFDLYKCLITGAPHSMNHGAFTSLSIHADAMVDSTRSTQAAGEIKEIQGSA